VFQSFDWAAGSLPVCGVEIPNKVTISAAIPCNYSEHRTKYDVGVELRLSGQQVRYPVWLGNLIVIDKGYQRRVGCRYSTIPHVRDSRARLVDINNPQALCVCDASDDVARRLLGTVIDDDKFVV
jgi:hypothetical protein